MNASQNEQGGRAASSGINLKLNAFSQSKKSLSEKLTNLEFQLQEQLQTLMKEAPVDIKFPGEENKLAMQDKHTANADYNKRLNNLMEHFDALNAQKDILAIIDSFQSDFELRDQNDKKEKLIYPPILRQR